MGFEFSLEWAETLWWRHFWWQTVPSLAAVTWNTQSLILVSRVSGTSSAEVDDECRRWDQEVQQQAVERKPVGMDTYVHQHSKLVRYSL